MAPNKKNLRRVLAMTTLSVYPQASPEQPNKVLTHAEDIASTLAEVGVRFAHSPLPVVLPADASSEAVLSAYQTQIQQLHSDTGLTAVDVLSFASTCAQTVELREGFLQEHTYTVDQVLLCVAGRGLLAVHIGEQVFELLCGKGDLVVLPAGTRHWLDIGEQPDLLAIRLRATADDTASLTGDPLSERFARLEVWM
jgi:1,2-dihydroxy-3-keto-5-methylthiopentene dioxygenase